MSTTPAPPGSSSGHHRDLVRRAADDDVDYVLALFVDLTGKPCAKLVPAASLGGFQEDGVGFAGFAVGALGQEPKDPDVVAVPDVTSYMHVPFIKPGLALVHCDPHVGGVAWKFAPRVILKKQLALAKAMGLDLQVGAEVEYFLVQRDERGTVIVADARDTAHKPCYDARDLTRMYDHLTAVSNAMNFLGWGNYANDHEDGNGQFEQNFVYADALTTADRVVTARYLISVLAETRGMTATFMPKPFTSRTGSGLHLHLSLWRNGTSCFPSSSDERGLGLSPLAYSFIAGLLAHAQGLQAIIGPTVNSYKRTGASTPRSGASWTPRDATYGGNDRTHFLRVPDEHRVELRGSDGSANPYLAAAGVLAAGLDGICRKLDPGEPNASEGPKLPMTLLHAVEAMERDQIVLDSLDACGPGVSSYYADLKRREFFEWHGHVSDWEVEHYLTAL
jgi:glutamine synthetase